MEGCTRIDKERQWNVETAERFLTSAHPASFWRDEIEENYTSHEITEEESRRTGAKEKHAGLDDLKRLFGDL